MATHPGDHKVGAEHKADIDLTEIPGSGSSPSTESSAELDAPSQIELLLRTVESELIPRLFVNHLMDVPSNAALVENHSAEPTTGPWSTDDSVAAFAQMCIDDDAKALDEHITDLLSQGVSLESLFLNLLTPAARHLGDGWLSDELSFVDVQLGLCRLHRVICECETIGYHTENTGLPLNSILLSSTPGENHTFGVAMVCDFFRRYGWRVSNLCGLGTDFILTRIESTHYSAVGFSLHNEYCYDDLAKLIKDVKSVSKNPDIVIMVGGDFFTRFPNKVRPIGADFSASDGRRAVLKATKACSSRLSAVT